MRNANQTFHSGYLGIQLPSQPPNLYAKNYLPILHNIQKDLKSWMTGLFSWFGRAAIIKMNILPRILYVLQTIPIKLPQAFYASYCRACMEFVWGKSHPILSFERIILPKLKGDIGFPDIAKHHWACQLTRLTDWNVHAHTKAWADIEDAFSSISICQLPWSASTHVPPDSKQHPLISNTLQIFKKACH